MNSDQCPVDRAKFAIGDVSHDGVFDAVDAFPGGDAFLPEGDAFEPELFDPSGLPPGDGTVTIVAGVTAQLQLFPYDGKVASVTVGDKGTWITFKGKPGVKYLMQGTGSYPASEWLESAKASMRLCKTWLKGSFKVVGKTYVVSTITEYAKP